jgi:peptide/nickel transport system ATP-binding protein
MNPPAIRLSGATASYVRGAPPIVRDVDLEVPRGGWIALVGESGSGKSTIARLALGLLAPTAGRVERFGRPIPPDLAIPSTERRRIQAVFQHPGASLDPRFDARETLLEPLVAFRSAIGSADREALALRLLDEVGLPRDRLRRPTTALSGGEQQRLCIARALAADPDALVLDEPLSALDPPLQATIVELLTRLRADRGLAYLFVSHDLRLVRRVADFVYVLRRGVVETAGTPEDTFENPRTAYVRRLVSSVLPAAPREARARLDAPDDAEADRET